MLSSVAVLLSIVQSEKPGPFDCYHNHWFSFSWGPSLASELRQQRWFRWRWFLHFLSSENDGPTHSLACLNLKPHWSHTRTPPPPCLHLVAHYSTSACFPAPTHYCIIYEFIHIKIKIWHLFYLTIIIIIIIIIIKKKGKICTLFTYAQSHIAVKKRGYWKGNNSWEAYRSADAAIIDGLNSKSFISA